MKTKIYPNMTLEANKKGFNLFDALVSLFNTLVNAHNKKVTEVLNSRALAETRVTDENRHELERIDKQLSGVEATMSETLKESVMTGLNDILGIAKKHNVSEADIEKDLRQFKIIANSLLEEKFF